MVQVRPGVWEMRWVPCGTQTCDYCGPWERAKRAGALYDNIGDTPLVALPPVDPATWDRSMRRRLDRAEVRWVRFIGPDGQLVIPADQGAGEPVTDNLATIRALLDAQPAEAGLKQSACKAWRPAKAAPVSSPSKVSNDDQAQDQAAEPERTSYVVRAGLPHGRELARELGLYLAEVAGADGDAFLLRQPDDALTWQRFLRWAEVERLGAQAPRRRRREAA
jgi:hypothetical protein